MKRHAILALFLIGLIAAGCGDSGDGTPTATAERAPADTARLRVGDAVVRAEVADDDAERALGLGGRDGLARDAGMYFELTSDAPRIWMKGMRFPLDLVWIRNGRVVDVTARVPNEPPGTPEAALPIYSPARPANRVLEVNAGWAKRNGVRAGDEVRLGEASPG